MQDEYINAAGNEVTQAWLDYVAPIAGDLPKMGRLYRVERKLGNIIPSSLQG